MTKATIINPFEQAGLGRAPFMRVGVFVFPSPSLAESDPPTYNSALAKMPREYQCGTCAFCGRSIIANDLIESADGKKFSVGWECVAMMDDIAV